jgi:hypothetical protein
MTDVFKLIEENGLTLHGDIEHFAELVRQDEREACAKVCEEDLRDAYIRQGKPARDEAMLFAAIADCANAIRARGEK